MDDVYSLLEFFNAEPQMYDDRIEALTICHSGDSHKMIYYDNSELFICYTHCGAFDIIELVQKLKGMDFNAAIYFLVSFFNLEWKLQEVDNVEYAVEDWKIFDRNQQLMEVQQDDKVYHAVDLKKFDDSIIQHYPQPIIKQWQDEHISKEVCDMMNIHYDPLRGCIVIPHYDEHGECIGIRQRTLIKDMEPFGKYKPWKHNKVMYNHPLGFNLYSDSCFWKNVQEAKIAIIGESEKDVLEFISYFGKEGNLCAAVCGSSLSKYQFETLMIHGVKEIVIAFDKDYHDTDDIENFDKFVDKMRRIYNKYGALCNMSFIVDTKGLLGYKQSPLDRGKEIFLELFKTRKYMR